MQYKITVETIYNYLSLKLIKFCALTLVTDSILLSFRYVQITSYNVLYRLFDIGDPMKRRHFTAKGTAAVIGMSLAGCSALMPGKVTLKEESTPMFRRRKSGQ